MTKKFSGRAGYPAWPGLEQAQPNEVGDPNGTHPHDSETTLYPYTKYDSASWTAGSGETESCACSHPDECSGRRCEGRAHRGTVLTAPWVGAPTNGPAEASFQRGARC